MAERKVLGETDRGFDPSNPTPFEVFEKALVKAMLKHCRVFVRREEVTECLPDVTPQSGVGRVDVDNYLFNYYEWGPEYDVMTFPELIQQLDESELGVFQYLLDCMVLDIDVDVLNRLVLEYINSMKFIAIDSWIDLLLSKARRYFVVKEGADVDADADYSRLEIYDGQELVAVIRRHRGSGEYFFCRVSSTDAKVPTGEL